MAQVRDLMTSNPVTCSSQASITDAAKVMAKEDIGRELSLATDTARRRADRLCDLNQLVKLSNGLYALPEELQEAA